jgi:hypothetical protein
LNGAQGVQAIDLIIVLNGVAASLDGWRERQIDGRPLAAAT